MNYENIFLPRIELLSSAGPDAITEFGDRSGRNLVVVPETYLFDLEARIQSDSVDARGAREALKYINQVLEHGGTFESADAQFTEPTQIGETLDITLARNDLRGRSLEETIQLVEAARTRFASSVTVITPREAEMTSLRNRRIAVEKPRFLLVNADIVKTGIIEGPDELLAELYSNEGSITLEHAREAMGIPEWMVERNQMLFPNQFIAFENPKDQTSGTVYAKVRTHTRRNKEGYLFERDRTIDLFNPHQSTRKDLYGISALNDEQRLALDLLLDDDVSLVFITGGHGSGKTLLSYVAGLDGIDIRKGRDDMRRYERLVIFKPNNAMGGPDRNLGDLPGDLWQKTRANMESYADAHRRTNLGFPFDLMLEGTIESDLDQVHRRKKPDPKRLTSGTRRFFPQEASPIHNPWSALVRGRTFQQSFILIDEAQNFRSYEVRTLIERGGKNSKTIVMGDPLQFDDTSQASVEINGLTTGIKVYQGKPYFGLIHLEENLRSQASNDAKEWRTY